MFAFATKGESMSSDEFTLADLNKAAKEVRHTIITNQSANYHYARSLGFNSYEASVLRGRSQDDIKRLALAKGLIKDNGDAPLTTPVRKE